MKSIEQVRTDYRRLERARAARDSTQVKALLTSYASSPGYMSRLWELVRGEPSIEKLLYVCCEEHDVDVAVDVVRSGANQYLHLRWGYPTAFDLAASHGDEGMCRALLEVGEPYGCSAGLESAAWANQLEIVRLLLERGADPQVVLSSPRRAYLFRIRGDVLRALVDAGGTPPDWVTTMLERRRALGDA